MGINIHKAAMACLQTVSWQTPPRNEKNNFLQIRHSTTPITKQRYKPATI